MKPAANDTIYFTWKTPIRASGLGLDRWVWIVIPILCFCFAFVSIQFASTVNEPNAINNIMAASLGVAICILFFLGLFTLQANTVLRERSEISFGETSYRGRMGSRSFHGYYCDLGGFDIFSMYVSGNVVRPCLYLYPYGAYTDISEYDFCEPCWTTTYSEDVISIELGLTVDKSSVQRFLSDKIAKNVA